MYVCMYVCTYVCMYVCIYIYIYIYTYPRASRDGDRARLPKLSLRGRVSRTAPRMRSSRCNEDAAKRDKHYISLNNLSLNQCKLA